MVTNYVMRIPLPLTFSPEFLPANAYYFRGTTKGRLPIEDVSFTQIDPPPDLPGYAIVNTQDFYLTPRPQFIVPIFFNLPKKFFSEEDSYHELTAYDVLRLDLVAYHYYINVEYWWIIAAANEILNPFNLAIGTILRIPSDNVVTNEWLQRPVKKVRDAGDFFFGSTS